MVVLVIRHECQDRQDLPVAEVKLPVHLRDFNSLIPAPREVRPAIGGKARVGDRTGDDVGVILVGHFWLGDCRFGWIGYKAQSKSRN